MTLLTNILYTHTHTHARAHTHWTKRLLQKFCQICTSVWENMGSETEAKAGKSLEKKRQLDRIHTFIIKIHIYIYIYYIFTYRPIPSIASRDVEILIDTACPSVGVEELLSLAREEGLVQYNESRVSTLTGSPVPKLDFAETNTVLCNKVSMSSVPV